MRTFTFSHSALFLALSGALALSACKGDDGSAGDDLGTDTADTDGIATIDGSTTADTTDTTTTLDTTDTTTLDTTDTTDTTSTTGPMGECGNGLVEVGEECDDGNTVDGDGCESNCQYPNGPLECNGQLYACGDTLDNDMDGLIDMDDPECISPCDDDEGSFKTNLPGQNNDCKSDCYFDSNSGGGDDKCEWNLKCDPLNPGAEIGCEYDPNLMCDLQMPQDCLDFCVPLVPNGCDCFGCCQIDGQFVYLDGADCALDNLDACQSCTFYENCNNPCQPELCELCFGQDPEDLPDECGGEPTCPPNLDPCVDTAECDEGWYCQTGCCVPVNIG